MIAYGGTLPEGRCRAVGGLSLTAHGAALVNGTVGNVLEMDDFYRTAIVHPGPVVIPAALAAATQETASGPALLDAVVRGFEAMIRVGRSVGPTHYKYFHSTATAGVFGSAAACGSELGLSEDALVHALGNAGTQASGLWQCSQPRSSCLAAVRRRLLWICCDAELLRCRRHPGDPARLPDR
jgi:2-methylcitrate dehydratase PrpD